MTVEEIKEHLRMAFWDVTYSPDTLYSILYKEVDEVGGMNRDRIYQRLLETFSWHTLMQLVPQEQWMDMLSEKVISRTWYKGLIERHRYARELLRRLSLSASR